MGPHGEVKALAREVLSAETMILRSSFQHGVFCFGHELQWIKEMKYNSKCHLATVDHWPVKTLPVGIRTRSGRSPSAIIKMPD